MKDGNLELIGIHAVVFWSKRAARATTPPNAPSRFTVSLAAYLASTDYVTCMMESRSHGCVHTVIDDPKQYIFMISICDITPIELHLATPQVRELYIVASLRLSCDT